MKTNYTNSKQKLFAVTLTIATIVSLAWINPAKKEKNSKSSVIQKAVQLTGVSGVVPIDTGKKKIKKAIISKNVKDSNAMTIHFPDTTKKNRVIVINSARPQVYISDEPSVSVRIDSILTPEISASISNFAISVKDLVLSDQDLKELHSKLEKQGAELRAKFNTPEQQAKWKKYAEDMQAKYNNPEERVKWQKYAKEAELKYNTPAERAKWKKIADDAVAKANSPEQKEMIIRLQKDAGIQVAKAQKLMQIRMNANMPVMIFPENEDNQKIKQTPEYIELKKKFDKDVEDLVNKKLKKENN